MNFDLIAWTAYSPYNVLDEYQYLGYENETPFAQMTWPEYKEAHYGTN